MKREKSQYIAEVGLLQGYIGILIDKMRGYRMFMPPMPYILGRDPPTQRHKTEYMPVPSGPIGGCRFAPVSNWV